MVSTVQKTVDELCVDTIRTLSIDAVQRANSGHPGLPLGAAPMAYVLWQRHLKHNPADPAWPDRDRFILSAGHGSMLLYALLHLTGYDLSLDDVKAFRQWGSRTPGHPEWKLTPGVEATTGPLGQGTGNAVGMALAERMLAERYNRDGHVVVDHRTWALVSDGDLMEGLASEAASLAGHLGLHKLTFLYDANEVSLDGPTSLTFTEDVGKRFEAFGWQVLRVKDGNTDLEAIDDALSRAVADTQRPSLIVVETTIGYGSPNKAGSSSSHGSPLGVEEVAATKSELGWEHGEDFVVPDEARAHFGQAVARGRAAQDGGSERVAAWGSAQPELAGEWEAALDGRLPDGWDADLPTWSEGEALATRVAGGQAMNAIAKHVPWLVGGDADLSCSTNTTLKGFDERNVHFGVREHAMAAMANGMAYHGGLRPFTATFFTFSDYMRPSIRLAALNALPVIYVWTHDSVALGEDGPTHQPVEHLMSLRAMPNMTMIRPADANETAQAWRAAMMHRDGPVGLVFSRQKLPVLGPVPEGGVDRGAYVRAEAEGGPARVILVATGSEVSLAMAARERLQGDGVPTRVVSMPSWELFERQPVSYRDEVLPPDGPPRLAIEAGAMLGWERYANDVVGLDRFGASAPGGTVLAQLGFDADRVVERARALLASP